MTKLSARLLAVCATAVLVCVRARPSVEVDSEPVLYRQEADVKPGLQVVYFGTSTLSMSDGVNAIMIDGFSFRPPLWRLLTTLSPDAEEVRFALNKAPRKIDAIFVAHSHHDHAIDAGLVAMTTGAIVLGSASTLNVARGQGTPEGQLRLLQARTPLQFGQFRIPAYETPHSPHPISPGFITERVRTPAKLSD